jgi:hypothetical protein
MTEPAEFPLPSVLESERPQLRGEEELTDAEGRAELLQQALDEACAYGRALWHDVGMLRNYLLASLPSDPRAPGPHRTATSPTGPDDADGWQAWIDAYAEASSVLAGPRGDSGFGRGVAQHEAELRRSAPGLRVVAETAASTPEPPATEPPARVAPAAPPLSKRLRSAAGVAMVTLLARRLVIGRQHQR